jgi:hypothetical protein
MVTGFSCYRRWEKRAEDSGKCFESEILLPECLTYWMLNVIQRVREKSGRNAKFPAYYQWCRGPVTGQFRLLESVGFGVRQYIGFFGHPEYYKRLPALERIHRAVAAWLQRHRVPLLTSFAYVVLEKK